MKVFIETERLILREILPSDIEGMFELDADPDVHRYLGNKPVTSKKESGDMIAYIRQQYADNGIGRWAIIDKKTGDFAGWSGIKLETTWVNNHINYYDLGYRLVKRYWGKGIATETAIVSLHYAFEKLNIEKVYAWVDSGNIASNNILKKAGLNFVERFYYEKEEQNWYQIERKAFESRPGNIRLQYV